MSLLITLFDLPSCSQLRSKKSYLQPSVYIFVLLPVVPFIYLDCSGVFELSASLEYDGTRWNTKL